MNQTAMYWNVPMDVEMRHTTSSASKATKPQMLHPLIPSTEKSAVHFAKQA